jgi:hypothetical protein
MLVQSSLKFTEYKSLIGINKDYQNLLSFIEYFSITKKVSVIARMAMLGMN